MVIGFRRESVIDLDENPHVPRQVVLEKLRHIRRMLFANVKILECRRESPHDQFIARSQVLVEVRHAGEGTTIAHASIGGHPRCY